LGCWADEFYWVLGRGRRGGKERRRRVMEARMAIGGERRERRGLGERIEMGEKGAEQDRDTDGPVSTAMVVAFFLDIVGMDWVKSRHEIGDPPKIYTQSSKTLDLVL
jgi:hypothetical protein